MQEKRSLTIAVLTALSILLGMSWLLRGENGNRNAYELPTGSAGKEDLTGRSILLQDRPNNCGPAALKMVLDDRGRDVSLRRLEREIRFSSKGVSMRALKEAAAKYGLQGDGWKLSWPDLEHVDLPAIVFLREDHFAVLDSVSAVGFAYLRNPSTGTQRIEKEKFTDQWSGETLVFARRLSADAKRRNQPQRETK